MLFRSSVRLDPSEHPVSGAGTFPSMCRDILARRPGTSSPSVKAIDFTPIGATTSEPYEVTESEGHPVGVAGVVVVGVAVAVHIAEVGVVAAIRGSLPPPVSGATIQSLTHGIFSPGRLRSLPSPPLRCPRPPLPPGNEVRRWAGYGIGPGLPVWCFG